MASLRAETSWAACRFGLGVAYFDHDHHDDGDGDDHHDDDDDHDHNEDEYEQNPVGLHADSA